MNVNVLPKEEFPQFIIEFNNRIVRSSDLTEIFIEMIFTQLNKNPLLGNKIEIVLVISWKEIFLINILDTMLNILKERLIDLFPFIIIFEKHAYIWDENLSIDQITDKVSLSLLEIPSFSDKISGMYISINSNDVDEEAIRTHFQHQFLELKWCLKKMNKRAKLTLQRLSYNKLAKMIMMKILKDFSMEEIVYYCSTFRHCTNEHWNQLLKKMHFLNVIILMSYHFNSYFNEKYLEEIKNCKLPNEMKHELKLYLIYFDDKKLSTNRLRTRLYCYRCLALQLDNGLTIQDCPHSANSE